MHAINFLHKEELIMTFDLCDLSGLSVEKLELVQISGPDVLCPLRHFGATYRSLRPKFTNRIPVMNWYRCPEGHGHKNWPETIVEARQLALSRNTHSAHTPATKVILAPLTEKSRITRKKTRMIIVLDSE
ncbi:hypothetical protein A2567_00855 [Candidatus Azambacteria bacterium RIFOXYD1_FULL_42_11]|uniref:Uncharacterized protein n=1 Tax=Candidatus Azambacteria bacterium RIFOXYD1_FULL_42_11 TaxID=1797310 RepID=A0A1F5CFY0_9BACT|nr:MAG: hypothetical protein A2567_00855 [Candidatus Azambacteria bacterium RIFOXYD1_FULL_42_11]